MNDNKERAHFIKSLVDIFNKNSLTSLEFHDGDLSLKLDKKVEPVIHTTAPVAHSVTTMPATPQAVAPAAPEPAPADDQNHEGAVKAPTVGVIYLKSSPDKPNFINVGSKVNVGDTLFLLEVMKVFTPIKAHKAGTIKSINVESQSVVEYNEVLAIIE